MDRARSNKSEMSLCEKSMLLVANLVRLSSVSVAQRTLQTTTTGKAGKDPSGPHDYSHVGATQKGPAVVHDQLLAERSRRAKPYLMAEPVGINQSTSHMTHEERFHEVKPKTEESVKPKTEKSVKPRTEESVKPKTDESIDRLASDYIRKMRKTFVCGS